MKRGARVMSHTFVSYRFAELDEPGTPGSKAFRDNRPVPNTWILISAAMESGFTTVCIDDVELPPWSDQRSVASKA